MKQFEQNEMMGMTHTSNEKNKEAAFSPKRQSDIDLDNLSFNLSA